MPAMTYDHIALEQSKLLKLKNLYAEVAKALGVDSGQIDRVKKIFAER